MSSHGSLIVGARCYRSKHTKALLPKHVVVGIDIRNLCCRSTAAEAYMNTSLSKHIHGSLTGGRRQRKSYEYMSGMEDLLNVWAEDLREIDN